MLAGLILLALGAGPTAAQPGLSGPYEDALRRYLSGDGAGAAADVATWSEERLREETVALRAFFRTAQACRPCAAHDEWQRIARAALMLHSDSARQVRREGRPARIEEGAAAEVAGMLATDPDLRAFAARWFETMAGLAQKENLWDEALAWAETGLRDLPGSADLLVVAASIEETLADQVLPPPGDPLVGTREGPTPSDLQRARQQLEQAQRRLREAAAAPTAPPEARLRLGRVSWRLGHADEARATLEGLVAQAPAGPTAFLAHLFLGRIHEDAARLPEALASYEAAVALDPTAQSARLALSHVRLRTGDVAAARAEAEIAVGTARHRMRDDPFWLYPWGPSVGAEDRLEVLRREASS